MVDRSDTPGWTFISHAPADDEKACASGAGGLVCRPSKTAPAKDGVRSVVESLPALLELKRELTANMSDTPFVAGDQPVVCAWYPTADTVLLWNLSETAQTFTLRYGAQTREVRVEGLDLEAVQGGFKAKTG